MDFLTIAQNRQSCRKYDTARQVEPEKLQKVLEAAALAPSACNSQPYHITVCTGDLVAEIASACTGMGINKFLPEVPMLLVISEESYNKTAALGAKIKGIDYRTIDIGILSAYITAEAAAQGLGSCIIGWLEEKKVRAACGLTQPVQLIVALGYPAADDQLRPKKRKSLEELVSYK